MTDSPDGPTPNAQQQALIDGTEGTYLVDAGPGTGKTFAVTRRYGAIIDQPAVEPADVLLVTFTRSAATEMKERVVEHSGYGMRELADAPIQTFHSHCHDILTEYGHAAPTHLGLDERITGSTRVIEDDLVEANLFREFLGQFRDAHPEHRDFFRALSTPTDLLDLIGELAAKGIVPTADGWYRDGEAQLDGDFEAFKTQFDAVNEPRNDGRKQSELRSDLSRFGRNKTYLPDAPEKVDLRGGRGTKQLDDRVARAVFEADRTALKAFVHDIYLEYLRFALARNYLTFGFLQVFAFVLLCENPTIRQQARFEYVMVDEFQDTSEIQFKLALLLAGTDNFCVVGDWKQSIYSFQYADVENILAFDRRLESFVADLDSDADRVAFEPGEIERIELVENYRSTQTILDFSEEALVTPATSNEAVDADTRADIVSLASNAPFDRTAISGHQHADEPEAVLSLIQEIVGNDADTRADIVSLASNAPFDRTSITGHQHADEPEAVLSLIQEIVGNDAYAVEDEAGEPRAPTYDDIAVFTRTRDYGRDLMAVADEYEFPMAYDGGVELFRTDPAKLLLAWLRILDSDADRGWAVVLERAGYTLDAIDHILDTETYPDTMVGFRETLRELASVGAVARRVFDRYGMAGDYADVLLHTIQAMHDTTTLTRGDLIGFIEQGIETGSTHEIHTSAGANSVTVQTIHAAKGLEYPIVILANMNEGRFPPRARDASVIQYDESVGLRQRKVYAEVPEHEHPHVYDNWRYDVIRRCLSRDYDEERRLLYVAITRAEQHTLFVGGEDPNTFLEKLPVDIETVEPTVTTVDEDTPVQADLPFAVTTPDGPIGHTPHSLMDESIFEDLETGMETDPETAAETEPETRGIDFGSRIHDFAEAYALGEDVQPTNAHERRVVALLDGLPGTLHVEEPVRLPLAVDGTRVTISGIVDLVHETDDTVEIIDYKTDSTRRAQPEYHKQLSVYYHVLDEWFEGKDVTTSIFYTAEDARIEITPLARDDLRALVRQQTADRE